jgi:hypothetical protein
MNFMGVAPDGWRMNCPYPLVAAGDDSLQRPGVPRQGQAGACGGLPGVHRMTAFDLPETLTISVVLRQVSAPERPYNEDADRELLDLNGNPLLLPEGPPLGALPPLDLSS